MAVGLIKLDSKEVMIISLYCDITADPIPPFLEAAISYSKQRGYAVLIAADTNSHSKLWGRETNKRGEKFEDFIQDIDVSIHNIGKEYTFECKTGKSVIDITLSIGLKVKLDLSLIHI